MCLLAWWNTLTWPRFVIYALYGCVVITGRASSNENSNDRLTIAGATDDDLTTR